MPCLDTVHRFTALRLGDPRALQRQIWRVADFRATSLSLFGCDLIQQQRTTLLLLDQVQTSELVYQWTTLLAID